jgi:hypothetical protein
MYTVIVMAGSGGNPEFTSTLGDLSRYELINGRVMQLRDALPVASHFTWSIMSDGDHDAVMFRTESEDTARNIIRIVQQSGYLVFVQAGTWGADFS